MSPNVVVAGGGIMGLATAYFLALRAAKPSSISVIEPDFTYKKAATSRSVGSLRQQFSTKENVLLSQWSWRWLKSCEAQLQLPQKPLPSISRVDGSYLFLASSEEGEKNMREYAMMQNGLGAGTMLMTPEQLKAKFPWLNVEDIRLGSIGSRDEGWFDPHSLLHALRQKVFSMGVRMFANCWVSGIDVAGTGQDRHVTGVHVMTGTGSIVKGSYPCDVFVNAAGSWSRDIAAMAGIGDPLSVAHTQFPANSSVPIINPYTAEYQNDSRLAVSLPVGPRKRDVYVIHCPKGPGGLKGAANEIPLVVDTSGVYFRRDSAAGSFIVGKSPKGDKDVDTPSLEVDYDFFEEEVWGHLAHRVPAFENLKMRTAWAGTYDYNTFDQNAVLGPHPVLKNFHFATGFSGHGVQQAPAVGMALSEWILDGKPHTVDVQRFGFDRILKGTPLKEAEVV